MNVLFDHQIFEIQRFGGISRYFVELFNQYKKTNKLDFDVSIRYSNNEYLKQSEDIIDKQIEPLIHPYDNFLKSINFKGKYALYKFFSTFKKHAIKNIDLSKQAINKGDFDVFHPTYYDTYYVHAIQNKPYVLTVYDMIHEVYSEQFLASSISALKNLLIKNASKIIAISESTKNDIIHFCNINPDKIDVIHLSTSLTANMVATKLEINLPSKYLLFVGNRTSYKNFYFFLQSIKNVLIKDRDLKVLCTGGLFTNDEIAFFKHLDVLENMQHYYVKKDEELAYLYKNAIAFVFPSLYEGFGIPVLEAFSCGCPALLSNTSSLPEVGGNAAAYFDPKNYAFIEKTVEDVVYNVDKQNELKNLGYKRLKDFSWEKTANQTIDVYKSVV